MNESTFRNITIEHLGSDATEGDLADFVAACERVEAALGSEEDATEFVWNNGSIRFNADTCIYCDQPIPDCTIVPAIDDDDAWEAEREWHYGPCEWVESRAHRLTEAGG